MDFLKKHYEKVLLGVVLLGLAVAVVFVMLKIPSEQEELDNKRKGLLPSKVKTLTNLDLALSETALRRVAAPAVLDFGPPNKLFNSMKWQRAADQHLIRVDSGNVGPPAVVVTNLRPLYLILKLTAVTVADNGVARYRIGIEKQAALNPRDRGRTEKYAGIGDKNDTFKVEAAYGPADNPTNVVLILSDSGEKASISKDITFQRIDGYLSDLKYPPENKSWAARRVGQSLAFNNEDYKIVAINKDEVILSSSIGKKTTIKFNPAP